MWSQHAGDVGRNENVLGKNGNGQGQRRRLAWDLGRGRLVDAEVEPELS